MHLSLYLLIDAPDVGPKINFLVIISRDYSTDTTLPYIHHIHLHTYSGVLDELHTEELFDLYGH